MPIMALFEDYALPEPESPFAGLARPSVAENRARLGRLARQAARYGIRILLMAYNPKLTPDHPVFEKAPYARGALQSGGVFRTLCTSDPTTRRFIVETWRSLFDEIPELGGILTITGGEGFYHCFMRSEQNAKDCPRYGVREPSPAVAKLVNDLARTLHKRHPEAVVLTWPYSAGHWSYDRDQDVFIRSLDPKHVIFQTEVDKDSVDWRPAGYAKDIWDYSMSKVTRSERIGRQRRQCRRTGIRFSVKMEGNNSIECLNVPYLPVMDNQRAIWENAAGLKPHAIHSRWLFDGSCKSPSEELGYWRIWGRGTEFENSKVTMIAIAERDFGDRAAPLVLRAWSLFSEAMRHHPCLDYYIGSYFIGPGQPLVLSPNPEGLDPAFYGVFYWQWEVTATDDPAALTTKIPLFYARPGFRALARRGNRKGTDVALDELKALASLWERGVALMDRAAAWVDDLHRPRFDFERTLAKHLAFTWRSAANVEEFLRIRDTILEFSGSAWVRAGHRRENRRDLKRLYRIAIRERDIARQDLALVRGVESLDLRFRLDMGVASTETLLTAKIRQLDHLVNTLLSQCEGQLEM
ncbi:MAG: hypothetical protein FJY97_19465 [candidate division Zixibacteria bacterium]|nr:hypothetical protein [candidate division Zixibacteria bacterium]